MDPHWQTSALMVKLLTRGLSVGYEPWKMLVRYRVAQTKQSRRGNWPSHANWIMNSRPLVRQGYAMWQGVMKSWSTLQSGLEQQDPTSWSEIVRQPLFGNRMLTNEVGVQWGTNPNTTMGWWPRRNLRSLQDIIRPDGHGWKVFEEQWAFRRIPATANLYARLRASIPWEANPAPEPTIGQWLAPKDEDGSISRIFQVTNTSPLQMTLYRKDWTEQLHEVGHNCCPTGESIQEVRVIQCGGSRRTVLNINPLETPEQDHTLWLWGNDWIRNLEWDPKEWQWRRIGALADTSILNYTTKRGYRVALRQNNHTMRVDAELEAAGYNSKERARFFNRIWHPHIPRKVSAMQWLVLTEGLPVGAWREKLGLPSECQLCADHPRETLQHAFQECPEICKAWTLFRNTRQSAGLPPAFNSWEEISRGLMTEPEGPTYEEDLKWDTAAAFKVTTDTPWDILRAHLLWAIWCQRVDVAFRNEQFHLGLILWNAWRNTIYCAMEAYKELFRHKRNEEKRQEAIACFQAVWTASSIFGRLSGDTIRWNLTPHSLFLPRELGAWLTPPIRIRRLSPSPDPDATFVAQPNFEDRIDDFLNEIASNWRPTHDSNVGETSQTRERDAPTEQDSVNPTLPQSTSEPLPPGSHSLPTWAQDNLDPAQDGAVTEPIKQTRNKPTSRNKRKCLRKTQHAIAQANTVIRDVPSQEARRGDNPRSKPTSRKKIKCRSGPTRQGDTDVTIPQFRSPSQIGHRASPCPRRWDASSSFLPQTDEEDPLDLTPPPSSGEGYLDAPISSAQVSLRLLRSREARQPL